MVIKIPNKNNLINPSYNNDYVGDVVRTDCLDFNKEYGIIYSGKYLYPYATEADTSTFRSVSSFLIDGPLPSTLCIANFAYAINASSTMTKITNSPDFGADGECVFHTYQTIPSMTRSALSLFAGDGKMRTLRQISNSWMHATHDTWTYFGGETLSSSYPIIMKTFGIGDVMFVANYNKIHSMPGSAFTNDVAGSPVSATVSGIINSRLVISEGFSINWMVTTSDKIYFGAKHGGQYHYDNSFVYEYDPINELVKEVKIKNGATIGFIVNNNLNIIDSFGNLCEWNGYGFSSPYVSFPNIKGSVYFNLPHRNGILFNDNKIRFNLRMSPNKKRMVGGIWVYDLITKQLYSEYKYLSSKTLNNCWGSGDASDSFGALAIDHTTVGNIYAGATISTSNSTKIRGLFSSRKCIDETYPVTSTQENIGSYVTSKIGSSAINSQWKRIVSKLNTISNDGGENTGTILVKYRTTNPLNVFAEYAGTWVTATTFTVASLDANIKVGDEIQIWNGTGSGLFAHITTIGTDSPKTITIDETLSPAPTGTFKFTVENWTKIDTISDLTRDFQDTGIPENESDWIQFKIDIRGTVGIEQNLIGTFNNLEVEKV